MNLSILSVRERYIFLVYMLFFFTSEVYSNELTLNNETIFSLEGYLTFQLYDLYPSVNYYELKTSVKAIAPDNSYKIMLYKYLYLMDASLRFGNTSDMAVYREKIDQFLEKKGDSVLYERILTNYLWGKYIFYTDEVQGEAYFKRALTKLNLKNETDTRIRKLIMIDLADCYIKRKRYPDAKSVMDQIRNSKEGINYLLQKEKIIHHIISYVYQSTNKGLPEIKEFKCRSSILKAELDMLYGILLSSADDIPNSEKYLNRAEKIYKESNLFSGYVELIHYIKSLVYLRHRNIKESERYYNNIILNNSKIDYSILSPYQITYLKAQIYFEKNEFNKAGKAFKSMLNESSGTIFEVYALIRLSNLNTLMRNYNEALKYLKRAERNMNTKYVYDKVRMSYYYSLAYLYYADPDIPDKINKLLEIYDQVKSKNRLYKRRIESYIGGYYMELGKYSEALPYFESASSDFFTHKSGELHGVLSEQSVYVSTDLFCIVSLAVCKYFNYKNTSHNIAELKSSFEIYKSVIEKIEDNFKYFNDDDEKLKYLGKYYINLDNAINIGYNLYEKTGNRNYLYDIAQLTQKSKAYVLRAAINDKAAKIYSGIPRHLIEYENNLKEEILKLTLDNEMTDNQNIPDIEMGEYSQQIFNLQEEHKALINKFEREYPDYYKLKYKNLQINADSIHNLLRDKQILLDYYHAFNALYIFVYTKDTLYIHCQDLPDDALDFVKTLRNEISGYNYGNFSYDAYKNYLGMSYRCYQLFIEPVKKYLSGTDHLIIIPDKEINLVPFEIFISDTANYTREVNYRDLPYLLRDYTVSYSYSASFIHPEIKKIINPTMLAFAPEYTLNPEKPRLGQFENLPGAHEEIDSITCYFKSKIITGPEANKKSLLSNADKFDIIHLALHTELDDNKPVYSRFVFSNNDMKDDLFVYEIYNENFKNDFLVLSGCNTGSGKINQGEGILSLARSFIYNGVSSMVLTQWSIEDNSSARLMNYFYSELASGVSSDEALRLAKLKYLKESDPVKVHPFYWAGFVHFGNPVMVKERMSLYQIVLYGFLIVVILVSLILIRKFIRR